MNKDFDLTSKDKIAKATFLLSLEYGFDNVSIKQIRKEANITTGAIYYHFSDKQEILCYLFAKYFKELARESGKNLLDFEGTFFEELKYFPYCSIGYDINKKKKIPYAEDIDIDFRCYHTLFVSIFHEHPEMRSMFYDVHKEVYKYCQHLTQKGLKNNEIRDDIDPDKIALLIFTFYKGFLDAWTGLPNCPLEKIIDDNVELIWEGIKKQ